MLGTAIRVWIFILSASFSFLLIGYAIGSRLGLFIGFGIAFAFNALLFYFGESKLGQTFHLQKLQGQDPWLIHHYLDKQCQILRIRKPPVYIVKSKVATAFCLGFSPFQSGICLTTRLVDTFTTEELETVLAYLLLQWKTLDRFQIGIGSVLANALVGLGESLDLLWLLPKWRRRGFFVKITSVVAWCILWITYRPQIFLDNDLNAAKLLNERRRLAEVLWRLYGFSLSTPLDVPPCSQHLFILNPDQNIKKGKGALFSIQPEIETRIRNLVGYYPI